jgi:hypothetical protein
LELKNILLLSRASLKFDGNTVLHNLELKIHYQIFEDIMQFPGFKLEKLNTRITTCSKLVSVTMETIYVFDSFFLQIKKEL